MKPGNQRNLRADDCECGHAYGVEECETSLECARADGTLGKNTGKPRAEGHDGEDQIEVGRVLEHEGRVAVSADEQIAQRAAADRRQKRQDERTPQIVPPLLGAHETRDAESHRAHKVQHVEPAAAYRLRQIVSGGLGKCEGIATRGFRRAPDRVGPAGVRSSLHVLPLCGLARHDTDAAPIRGKLEQASIPIIADELEDRLEHAPLVRSIDTWRACHGNRERLLRIVARVLPSGKGRT